MRTLHKTLASGLLVGAMMLSLAGCAGGSQAASTAAASADDSISGIYSNTLTGEDMRDRLVASWSAVTHLDTLTQENNLVLTEANSTMDTDRYELTKDLYNGEMGIHIEARFYGEFTVDGNTVTLETPEYYTWIYYRNGTVMGTPVVYQPVDESATGNDGASFFGDYLDYHGYHRIDEMNVTVDTANDTFTFDIQSDDDSAELGTESEDDGFSAGPIYPDYVQEDQQK